MDIPIQKGMPDGPQKKVGEHVKLPDGTEWSDLPLFIWKWQFCKHFKLDGRTFRAMMTDELVGRMGVSQEVWRFRQKIFRPELPALMSEFKITAGEMVKISEL